MSFLFPRTVAVHRPAADSGVGFQAAYAGQTQAAETPILTGLQASIQVRREGSVNKVGLPGDGTAPFWDVFLHRRDVTAGQVMNRDIIIDDLSRRFQVVASDYESLNPRFRCMQLEA